MTSVEKNKVLENIIAHTRKFDLHTIEPLTAEEKHGLAVSLIDYAQTHTKQLDRMARIVGFMVPYIPANKRFSLLSRLINVLHDSEKDFGKDIYNALDFSVARYLQPLELLSLANLLSEFMHSQNNKWREASMWGLIRIIPHLHAVNQKEYAQDIYLLGAYPEMRGKVVDGLTSLIYSLNQEARTELTVFFADMLKKQDVLGSRGFAIDLLVRVTPSLPEEDRVIVADHVSPLIYFSDADLVKKSIRYFATVISLLPENERHHYTHMIAGLINDNTMRADVIRAIEKSLPFLTNSKDKLQFVELLMQYRNALTETEVFDEASLGLELNYYQDKLT